METARSGISESISRHCSVSSGDSGGPVFAEHGFGAPTLLGLISERIGPKTDRVPLAVVINTSVIRETLAMYHQGNEPGRVGSLGNATAMSAAPAATVKSIGPPELLHKVLRAEAP